MAVIFKPIDSSTTLHDPQETTCTICLDDSEATHGHPFSETEPALCHLVHKDCLLTWLNTRDDSCPTCRKPAMISLPFFEAIKNNFERFKKAYSKAYKAVTWNKLVFGIITLAAVHIGFFEMFGCRSKLELGVSRVAALDFYLDLNSYLDEDVISFIPVTLCWASIALLLHFNVNFHPARYQFLEAFRPLTLVWFFMLPLFFQLHTPYCQRLR